MAYAYKGVAPALNTLLAQLNEMAPKRKKASDGALGDQAHAARKSYHNPNSAGIVQARDFTHDPAGGLDCNWLANALVAGRDKRILEIIWNRRYWTPRGGWVTYYGSNPHDKHLHLSVSSDANLYNSTAPWDLGKPSPGIPLEDDLRADEREWLADIYNRLRGDVTDNKDRVHETWEEAKAARDAAVKTLELLQGPGLAPGDRLAHLWTQANDKADALMARLDKIAARLDSIDPSADRS